MKKTVLVTGGSRGIGRACCELFAQKGFNVVLNYNKSGKEAMEICGKYGCFPVRADVSKRSEVEEMSRLVGEKFGYVDVLVNNAGVAKQLLFSDIDEEEWDRVFDTNVKGTYLVTHAFLPGMIHNKRGSIVNISSVWGITGASCEVHYSASKGAVIAFTKALAKEVAPSGISVNCVAPGVIDTEMNSSFGKEDMEYILEDIPSARVGKASEIAECVFFLAHDRYITGQVISPNGGMVI
ncbi:MAG: SDR family NAD(P)-dependent oxidoreductase [Oscillospiraceae bacterium]|nr:SDR family NAD(P)-dependent oxidoreductase [Oscillospiraceae bacterium]